jgi:hypothetical protein
MSMGSGARSPVERAFEVSVRRAERRSASEGTFFAHAEFISAKSASSRCLTPDRKQALLPKEEARRGRAQLDAVPQVVSSGSVLIAPDLIEIHKGLLLCRNVLAQNIVQRSISIGEGS